MKPRKSIFSIRHSGLEPESHNLSRKVRNHVKYSYPLAFIFVKTGGIPAQGRNDEGAHFTKS